MKGNNEVTLFDCESGFRQKTLWASKAPALSSTQSQNWTPDSVLGMIYNQNRDGHSSLITCGTDMRIRCWDLNCPEKSYVMSDGIRHNCYGSTGIHPYHASEWFSYDSKITDGIQVYQEHEKRYSAGASGGASSSHHHTSISQTDPNAVSPCHRDSITDMMWIESSNILVSSSRDGVIKMWK